MNILCMNYNIFHSFKLGMASMFLFTGLIHDLSGMFAQLQLGLNKLIYPLKEYKEECIFHMKYLQSLCIEHNSESDKLHILPGHLKQNPSGKCKLFHLYLICKVTNIQNRFEMTFYMFYILKQYRGDNFLSSLVHNLIYKDISLNTHLK